VALTDHVNVWNTALQILRRRGHALRVQLADDDDQDDTWWAEEGDFKLSARDPIALLGLVAIRDEVQPTADTPYWWSGKTDARDVRAELVRAAEAREREVLAMVETPDGRARVVEALKEAEGDLGYAASMLGGVRRRTVEEILAAHPELKNT
jgi:hypothetical protein